MRGNLAPYSTEGHYPLPLGFNGRWAYLWRWFSGRPMNGHRYTDATGFRYGTMALDVSGHATTFQLLPGYKRFLYARLPVMALPWLVLAWLMNPAATYLALGGLATLAAWEVDKWRRVRRFRKDVIEPVSAGAAAVLKTKRAAGQGHTWVTVPPDFRDNPDAKVSVRLPLDFIGYEAERAALVATVSAKLNMDELTPAWSLHGAVPTVTFSVPPAPPKLVTFAEATADAEAMDEGSIMVGYGPRRKVEVFSLLLESPHAILNGGSGAGKSVLLAFMVAQFMRRGSGVLVLDAKFVSHMWLRRVPGVHYASEAEDMHLALCWLDEELLRRARFVSTAKDLKAAMASLVPLVVIMEEMTAARGRLDRYWKGIKGQGDPALSPALAALANVANMGRELRVHAFLAGQSLTAKTTGGPEGRESYGARMLARATSNAWRMLAPQIKPAPVKRGKPGAWHIVVGDVLRAFQVPFVDLKDETNPNATAELIEWATGGLPVPDVSAMIDGWEPEGWGGGGEAETPSSEPPTPAGISLRQYADEAGLDLKTLTRWRERRNDFPTWVALGARGVQLFERDHLKAYVAARLREPVGADE
jgi:hypothetical protein